MQRGASSWWSAGDAHVLSASRKCSSIPPARGVFGASLVEAWERGLLILIRRSLQESCPLPAWILARFWVRVSTFLCLSSESPVPIMNLLLLLPRSGFYAAGKELQGGPFSSVWFYRLSSRDFISNVNSLHWAPSILRLTRGAQDTAPLSSLAGAAPGRPG